MREDNHSASMNGNNGYHGYGEGDRNQEYREMQEIDVQQYQQQQQRFQQQQQQYQQQQFQQQQEQQHYQQHPQDQQYQQDPYHPPPQQQQGYSPYQPYEDPQGRPPAEQAVRAPPPGGRPDDYAFVNQEWPLSAGGSPNPQFFADTPGGSRAGTPSLSGRGTPLDAPHIRTAHSSVDWRPNSLMVNEYADTPTRSQFADRNSGSQNQSHLSLAALLPPGSTASSPPNVSKDFVAQDYASKDNIQQVHKRDDVEIWSGWKRHLYTLTPFLIFINTGLYFAYLALRVACVIWAQNKANAVYAAAWVFIAVEIVVAIPSQMHNGWTLWSLKKRHRPKLRLTGNVCPTVDVFVTCCGEDDDLVMDTVRAACDQDYPQDRFRVVILDDGKSAGLEAQIAQLAITYPNLHYIARLKIPGVPHHFKAGNLNNGLDQMHTLPGGAGEFMAALDADMIPERDWLRGVLPHLLVDPKMALACPPQLFYNTPRADPLSQSLDVFVHVIEPIKDALGVAWCTGSGYVVRREALDQIGNFPLGSLAEDVATSTLMLGKGWKTAYVHEPLQFGTVPDDYGSHLKQRTRWAIGTLDTSLKLNFLLWGDQVKNMKFAQRFSGFLYGMLNVYAIAFTVSLFGVPIILAWGKPLVAYATDDQLRWLVRVCFATVMCNRLCEFIMFIPAGYHTGQRGSRAQVWMSPYIALCIIRSFMLPTWLGGQTQAFKPTGSLGSELNERDAKLRKNMLHRMFGIIFNYMGWFHFVFVYFTLVALVVTVYRQFWQEYNTKDLLLNLVTHAFWPPLTFLFLCNSMWTPISYAIEPPTVPDREDLLDRDPKTRIAHPKPESKKIAFGGQAAWFEIEYTFTTAYTCLLFVATFFW